MAMTKEELIEYNVGENLDSLMNLDPRGYGVCRILYKGSRDYTGEHTFRKGTDEGCKARRSGLHLRRIYPYSS